MDPETISLLPRHSMEAEDSKVPWPVANYLKDIKFMRKAEQCDQLPNIDIFAWFRKAEPSRPLTRMELELERREAVVTIRRRWWARQEYPSLLKQKLGNVQYEIDIVANLNYGTEDALYAEIISNIVPQFPFLAKDVLAHRNKLTGVPVGDVRFCRRLTYEVGGEGDKHQLTTTVYNLLLVSYCFPANIFEAERWQYRLYLMLIDLSAEPVVENSK